jgi:hypothetical protein
MALGAAVVFCAAPFAWRAFGKWFFGQDGGL